jgi:hypothetical protein
LTKIKILSFDFCVCENSFFEVSNPTISTFRMSSLQESINATVAKYIDHCRSSFENQLKEKEVENIKTIMNCFDAVFSGKETTKVTAVSKKQEATSLVASEEVKIILDYGTKNHALFGPFGATYKEFKDSHLKGHAKYNAKLKNGPGWIFNKDDLAEMEEKLREADIPFTKIDKKGEVVGKKVEKAKPSKKGDSDSEASEEEKPKKKVTKAKQPSKKKEESSDSSSSSESSEEEKPAPKKIVKQLSKLSLEKEKAKQSKKEESSSSSSSSESSEEEKPAPKKVEKKTAPVVSKPDVPPKPSALKVTRNSFGNLINAETGAVFASLMVGGRKTNVAIGIQNNETEKTGVESLLPLDKERVEICKKTGRKILDEEFFKTLSEEDQRTYKNLVYSDKKEEESDGEEDEGEESNDSSSEDDEE